MDKRCVCGKQPRIDCKRVLCECTVSPCCFCIAYVTQTDCTRTADGVCVKQAEMYVGVRYILCVVGCGTAPRLNLLERASDACEPCTTKTIHSCFSGVFGDDVVTVMEGDSVTLHTDITKKEHDKVLWYFEDTRIALINGRPNTSCLYDGEGGRFRDRLKVDYETGSLTITDIRSEHTGRYEAEIIRSESSGKRQSLNRNRKCDSTKITKKISITHDDTIKTFSMIVTAALSDQVRTEEPRVEKRVLSSGVSSAAVAGICAAVLLLVTAVAAAAVIYYRQKISKNAEREKNMYKGLPTDETTPKV
uniref:Immunoglobulin V-set domain-containing protein n=1 Tax=Cyprinus carpio TaxID=7962 RepID=A0A8C1QT67_CYPCA